MATPVAVRHTGDGVARRAAHHERRAQERAQLEELVTEQLPADNAVRMAPATEVLAQVAVDGTNYPTVKRRETKRKRR